MITAHTERFQAVLLLTDGEEIHHWTHYKEIAISVARRMRESHPDAVRVLVYDHAPTELDF